MNILEIQDSLKGMSDAALQHEMQNPSGAAPQYLILSEIQRRTDMRKKVQQAPQTTVADDAVSNLGGGIGALPSGLPQAERMYQGGPVHFAVGGITDPWEGGGSYGGYNRRPLGDLSQEELNVYIAGLQQNRRRDRLVTHNPDMVGRLAAPGAPYTLEELISERNSRVPREANAPPVTSNQQYPGVGMGPETEPRRELPGTPNRPAATTNPPASAPAIAPPAQATPDIGNPMRGMTENYGEGVRSPASAYADASPDGERPSGQGEQQGRPSRENPYARMIENLTRPGGGGTGAGGGGGARTGGGGIPSIPAPGEGGAGTFEGRLASIRGQGQDHYAWADQEIQRLYGNTSQRRADALNYALMEMGMRMAGTQNPNLLGAIGEGGIAGLTTYRREMESAERAQREGLSTRLGLSRARSEEDRGRQQLAASLYGTDVQERNAAADRDLRRQQMAQSAGASGRSNELARLRLAFDMERAAAEDRRATERLSSEERRAIAQLTPAELRVWQEREGWSPERQSSFDRWDRDRRRNQQPGVQEYFVRQQMDDYSRALRDTNVINETRMQILASRPSAERRQPVTEREIQARILERFPLARQYMGGSNGAPNASDPLGLGIR